MDTEIIFWLLGAYALICFIVAATAGNRGWDMANAFFVCVLTSPLIGAILFAPYKQTEPTSGPGAAQAGQKKEDPALANLIEQLEKKLPDKAG